VADRFRIFSKFSRKLGHLQLFAAASAAHLKVESKCYGYRTSITAVIVCGAGGAVCIFVCHIAMQIAADWEIRAHANRACEKRAERADAFAC